MMNSLGLGPKPRYSPGMHGHNGNEYDPRPPFGYGSDPRLEEYPPRGRQSQILTPANKKRAFKFGGGLGQKGAQFGFGKFQDNVDLGQFDSYVDQAGEEAIDYAGDRMNHAIDNANFGEYDSDYVRPDRLGSRNVQDVMNRRARELSPARGPGGPFGYGQERDYDPYYGNAPQSQPPARGYTYDKNPREVTRLPRDPDYPQRPVPEPSLDLDDDSRFGDVPYKDVPTDVRSAYERKLRGQAADEPLPRGRPLPEEDEERQYYMYPQGYVIQPGKYATSPPPSYRASAQHPAMRYPAVDESRAPWEYDERRPPPNLAQYRSY